jgi:hypothetical protein
MQSKIPFVGILKLESNTKYGVCKSRHVVKVQNIYQTFHTISKVMVASRRVKILAQGKQTDLFTLKGTI